MTSSSPNRLRLSATQLVASAAAAATAAFAASTLGVAGTVLGAALFSAVITVSAAVYDHSIRRARDRLLAARLAELATKRSVKGNATGPAQPDAETAAADLPADTGVDDATVDLGEVLSEDTDPLGLSDRAGYRWGRIAVVALAVFGLAMAVVTAVELVTGQPVSSLLRGDDTSGTTIGRVVDRPGSTSPPASPTPTPTVTETVAPTPTVTETVTTTPTPTPTRTSPPPTTTSPQSTPTGETVG